jgi:hypothetical protein
MPFTDRNHILLKLGFLGLLAVFVFGPKPSLDEQRIAAQCQEQASGGSYPIDSHADDLASHIERCIANHTK